jgi:signal transduction histidine kinase
MPPAATAGNVPPRVRVALVLALVAVLLPAAGGVVATLAERGALSEQVEQSQLAAATAAASEVDQGLDYGIALAQSAARRPGLTIWTENRDVKRQVDVLKNVYSTTPTFRGLFVFDPEGALMSRFPTDAAAPPAEQASIPAPTILPPVRAGADAIVVVREPFVNTAGRTVGFLLAELSLDKVAPIARSIRVGRTGRASVVDRSGTVLLSGEPQRVGTQVASAELLRLARGGSPGQTQYFSSILDRGEIAAYAPVPGRELGVILTQSQAETFAAVNRLTRNLVLLLAAFVLAGFVVVGLVWKTIAGYERRLHSRLDEMARLNTALESYGAHVAHDLRNPLGAIKLATELATNDAASHSPTTTMALETIGRQADRGLNLVESLLELARASGTPRPEPIDLRSLVNDVANQVGGVAVEVETLAPVIVADRTGVRQALVNLLQNAGRYGRSNGAAAVTIGCEQSADGWVLSVADRGPGIPPDEAAGVFKPFERGSGSAKHPGAGIGLAIVSAVAQAHGGRAWYEPRDGGGSVFKVEISAHLAETSRS